ncbi:hypothetical protein [Methylocapsa sp. S129]|uniref:hypothetical protein n=1 Tax=Methylocapsa sp. S129 TaxID=1641869 RepID=UPI00131E9957|nr:hypothetical protein [Methylocapsa sp. S129]
MTNNRRFLSIAAPLALLISAQAPRAAEQGSWDGAWTGSLGNVSAISVTIANDKVVDYSFRGAPIKIVYDKVADTKVSFGDPDHYRVTLIKTSGTTASAKYHDRTGYSTAVLTRN